MLRLFIPFLCLGLLLSVPATAASSPRQESICGGEKNLFCTSTRGYLTLEQGDYVVYPQRSNPAGMWEFLYITTSEKVHTPNPVLPQSVRDALPRLVADTVLTGTFEYCVLVPMNGPGAERRNFERAQHEKSLPAKLCRAWQMQPLSFSRVENELLTRNRTAPAKGGKTQAAISTQAPEAHISTQSVNTSRACRESTLRKGSCSEPIQGWVYRANADNVLTFMPKKTEFSEPGLPTRFHVNAMCMGSECRGSGPVFQLSGEGSADGIRLPETLTHQLSIMDSVKSTAVAGTYVVCPFRNLVSKDFNPTERTPGCIASVTDVRQVRKVSVGKASVSPVD